MHELVVRRSRRDAGPRPRYPERGTDRPGRIIVFMHALVHERTRDLPARQRHCGHRHVVSVIIVHIDFGVGQLGYFHSGGASHARIHGQETEDRPPGNAIHVDHVKAVGLAGSGHS